MMHTASILAAKKYCQFRVVEWFLGDPSSFMEMDTDRIKVQTDMELRLRYPRGSVLRIVKHLIPVILVTARMMMLCTREHN